MCGDHWQGFADIGPEITLCGHGLRFVAPQILKDWMAYTIKIRFCKLLSAKVLDQLLIQLQSRSIAIMA